MQSFPNHLGALKPDCTQRIHPAWTFSRNPPPSAICDPSLEQDDYL